MKKFCISLVIFAIIFLTTGCTDVFRTDKGSDGAEYLRLHIRANSDSDEDQAVKYAVKDRVVEFLTPVVAGCKDKAQAEAAIRKNCSALEKIADETLKSKGFTYSSSVKLTRETFPTRVYDGVTLPSGEYDALIIGLGEAKGDNWWCVVYPPLCFTGGENVRYKSKIIEIIAKWRRGG